MENKFVTAAKAESNKTFTENGCEAYKSTTSAVLDLFATVGGLRQRSDEEICKKFEKAYREDALLALKCLFYARDIRGGCGERRTFRVIVHYLADAHPEALINNIQYIGQFGRYDDLYSLVGTKLENVMWEYMKGQFEKDLKTVEDDPENANVSLLAKWIKSPDATSASSKELGIATARAFGYNKRNMREYKRKLRLLRKYCNIVETKMCQQQWDTIDYESVPSRAMMLYRTAFAKHAPINFGEYMEKLKEGKAEVKAATLYPYDIVRGMVGKYYEVDDVLEAQWKALPNYVVNADNTPFTGNILVMSDVSGSMTCMNSMPLYSSIGLGIYFAQRNKGIFNNLLMTFSSDPQFVDISDCLSTTEAVEKVYDAEWQSTTNFAGAMDVVLNLAVKNQIPCEDMPKALLCISDMEFDSACGHNYSRGKFDWNEDIVSTYQRKFADAGYDLPTIVFWNVNSRNDTFHFADGGRTGVIAVSGNSVSAFKTVISCLSCTPYEAMCNTLNDVRYECITIKE